MRYLKIFEDYNSVPDISNLTLNTSNKRKLEEFRKFGLNCDSSSIDLEEPLSDPMTIIRYKATNAGENVIVEDSNFSIDGTDIGVDIKFRKNELMNHIGSKASFDVWLGFLQNGKVYIFRGKTDGKIVEPIKGVSGWDFDLYFKPNGSDYTFAQKKDDKDNPRYKALQSLLSKKPFKVLEPLKFWDGDFQK